MVDASLRLAAPAGQTLQLTERNAISVGRNQPMRRPLSSLWENGVDGPITNKKSEARYPVVHIQGGSAIRRALLVRAVCACAALGYLARDFLIPTAGAVVLALILTPVANTLERLRLPPIAAAAASVTLLAMGFAALLAISIPALTNWIDQGPFLTYTMERKLDGLRKSIAIVQEVSKQVEQATSAAPTTSTTAAKPPEKI